MGSRQEGDSLKEVIKVLAPPLLFVLGALYLLITSINFATEQECFAPITASFESVENYNNVSSWFRISRVDVLCGAACNAGIQEFRDLYNLTAEGFPVCCPSKCPPTRTVYPSGRSKITYPINLTFNGSEVFGQK